jgi:hypothetical protein
MKPVELWMPVVGYEELYLASNLGRIKVRARKDARGHQRKEKVIATRINANNGYELVNLYNPKEGVARTFAVHRLVLAAFTGYPQDKKMTVNHKNGIKTDNHLRNLEWMTLSGNMLHAYRTGLSTHAKLTAMDVRRIKILLSQKMKHGVIASMYGVSRSTIAMISCGINWKWMNEGERA